MNAANLHPAGRHSLQVCKHDDMKFISYDVDLLHFKVKTFGSPAAFSILPSFWPLITEQDPPIWRGLYNALNEQFFSFKSHRADLSESAVDVHLTDNQAALYIWLISVVTNESVKHVGRASPDCRRVAFCYVMQGDPC